MRAIDIREKVSRQNKQRTRLGTIMETNFTREKLVLFMRLSRMACIAANGAVTLVH